MLFRSNSAVINKGLNLASTFGIDVGKVDFWKTNIAQKVDFNIGSCQVSTAATTVAKQNQTITFTDIADKLYGTAPFSLQATATSGLAVSYRVVSGPATLSGSTLTLTGTGTVNIEASQSGNTTYNAAPTVSQSFLVSATTSAGTSTRIEAEKYASMSGINTETTSDVGGGQNVGRLDANDWLKYNVNVSATGTYTLNFRVAGNTGGQFEVRNSSGTILKTVDVPVTGGWQSWKTVSVPVALNSGSQTIQIYVKKSGWNFNWFEITGATSTAQVQSARSQFTEDLSVQKSLLAPNITWSVYPNPTPDKVQVNLGREITGEVNIDLVDISGKIINHLVLQKSTGELTQTLTLDNLTNGLYFIQLRAKGVQEVKKVLKR